MSRLKFVLAVTSIVLSLTSAAWAQNSVAGAWEITVDSPQGPQTSTLTLKQDGEKLTGTISSPRGSVALNEIDVKGDDVTFAIVRVGFGDSIRIEYSGKTTGDTMNLKIKFGARPPVDATAKRK